MTNRPGPADSDLPRSGLCALPYGAPERTAASARSTQVS